MRVISQSWFIIHLVGTFAICVLFCGATALRTRCGSSESRQIRRRDPAAKERKERERKRRLGEGKVDCLIEMPVISEMLDASISFR